jgi:hypothetical protein
MNWQLISQFAQVIQTLVVFVLAPFALWQLWLQKKATQQQSDATLSQTTATIISWVQAQEIRESRGLLYRLDEKLKISERNGKRWKEEWNQAADSVSHCFNSAAIVVQQDLRLEKVWVQRTKPIIRRTWKIVQPRILMRRIEIPDLWKDFEWLAKRAEEL